MIMKYHLNCNLNIEISSMCFEKVWKDDDDSDDSDSDGNNDDDYYYSDDSDSDENDSDDSDDYYYSGNDDNDDDHIRLYNIIIYIIFYKPFSSSSLNSPNPSVIPESGWISLERIECFHWNMHLSLPPTDRTVKQESKKRCKLRKQASKKERKKERKN